jgi:hypothetical protein
MSIKPRLIACKTLEAIAEFKEPIYKLISFLYSAGEWQCCREPKNIVFC